MVEKAGWVFHQSVTEIGYQNHLLYNVSNRSLNQTDTLLPYRLTRGSAIAERPCVSGTLTGGEVNEAAAVGQYKMNRFETFAFE